LSPPTTRTRVSFDDPHLVSQAGLVPVMALAGRADLGGLAADHVRTARHARGHLALRRHWHRQHEWPTLREAASGPPATTA
jgi:hypothetical protein